jgi:hypothetical protein
VFFAIASPFDLKRADSHSSCLRRSKLADVALVDVPPRAVGIELQIVSLSCPLCVKRRHGGLKPDVRFTPKADIS